MRFDGRDVHLAADLAHAEDEACIQAISRSRASSRRELAGARIAAQHDGRARRPASGADALPDLLGDERHQRMQRALQRFQNLSSVWRAPRLAAAEALSDCSTGLVSSRYQSQNSYQVNSYSAVAAKSNR